MIRGLLATTTALFLTALAVPAPANAATTLLSVNDGDFFYDGVNDGVCSGTTDNNLLGVATRHWHQGNPLVNLGGGFGCLGPPKIWTLATAGGTVVTATGNVRYTWDRDVPGGGNQNEVHIHVYAVVNGVKVPVPVATTLTEGPKPANGGAIAQHNIDFSLPGGLTYQIEENIWAGSHTAWLTKLTVTQS